MTGHRGAIRWDGTADHAARICAWMHTGGQESGYSEQPPMLNLGSRSSPVLVAPGDWVVRDNDGVFRPYTLHAYAEQFGREDDQAPLTVYACIGNSDDKLTQQRWHEFWCEFRAVVVTAARVHGEWLSISCAPYQNGCICFEITPEAAAILKASLAELASRFGQDSIAWAVAATEFITPPAAGTPAGEVTAGAGHRG